MALKPASHVPSASYAPSSASAAAPFTSGSWVAANRGPVVSSSPASIAAAKGPPSPALSTGSSKRNKVVVRQGQAYRLPDESPPASPSLVASAKVQQTGAGSTISSPSQIRRGFAAVASSYDPSKPIQTPPEWKRRYMQATERSIYVYKDELKLRAKRVKISLERLKSVVSGRHPQTFVLNVVGGHKYEFFVADLADFEGWRDLLIDLAEKKRLDRSIGPELQTLLRAEEKTLGLPPDLSLTPSALKALPMETLELIEMRVIAKMNAEIRTACESFASKRDALLDELCRREEMDLRAEYAVQLSGVEEELKRRQQSS